MKKMDDQFSTNKKLVAEPKIKELPFPLTKITSLDELHAFNNFHYTSTFQKTLENFFANNNKSLITTTYSFIQDMNLINKFLIAPVDKVSVGSNKQTISALTLRVQRFRLKFFIIHKINMEAPNTDPAINKTLDEILAFLKQKKIHTTFTDKGSAYAFTFESTCSVIASELKEAEKRLRRLLVPLRVALGATTKVVDWSAYSSFVKRLSVCTGELMPDWHYLFTFFTCPPQMDAVQLKQWNSYMVEIHELLELLFLLCPNNVNLEAITYDDTKGINFKLSKLKLADKLNTSTFIAIITALNRFVPQLWIATITSLATAGIIGKMPAADSIIEEMVVESNSPQIDEKNVVIDPKATAYVQDPKHHNTITDATTADHSSKNNIP